MKPQDNVTWSMPNDDKPPTAAENTGWHREICCGILMAHFLVLTVIYPFYMTKGYLRIGEDKFIFYRNTSLVTLGALGLIILLSLAGRQLRGQSGGVILKWYHRLSVTDWFAYGYIVAVFLSYLATPYREEALWGVKGWYMGLVTQLMFVLFYFFYSRFFFCSEKFFWIWLVTTAIVFGLGILNRYSVYPIAIEGQTPTFISTLGNINWFSGYWAVTCPIGVMLYWNTTAFFKKLLTGIFCIIAFLAGIVQGSSSAFIAFAVVFYFVFLLSFEENRKLYTFIELCILFAISCQAGRALRYLPMFQCNYETTIGKALTDSGLTIWIAVAGILLHLLFHIAESKKGFRIEDYKIFRKLSVFLAGIAAISYVALVAINTYTAEGVSFLSGRQAFLLDDNWGNSRGATWNAGITAFRSFDTLHKTVGIGADCFAEYCYDLPALAAQLADSFGNERLTNAHNEWITSLVNFGLLGLTCYLGIFISAEIRFLKRAGKQPLLYLCAASALAYMTHNIVSFQQVLSTPFVFIILGIGERMLTQEKNAIS